MITIEPLTAEHLDQVAAWLADPTVNRWLTSEWRDRPVTGVIVAMAVKSRRNRLFLVREDGQACGLVALADVDSGDRTAMVWYVLGDATRRGRGITVAAIERLLDYAVAELGLCSLYAWIMEDNVASRRVLEKSGFLEAGRLRAASSSAGRQVDRVYFDWVCAAAAALE